MRNNQKNGQGIYYYVDGRLYKGFWVNDTINGYGA